MNLTKKKFLIKVVTFGSCLLLLINSLTGVAIYPVLAEDSPEEILRQQEEAQREAEADAQKQARREAAQQAEAERESLEAQREAVEDLVVTPTPTPLPTTNSQNTAGTTVDNSQTGQGSENYADSTSDTNLDNQNQNQDTTLDQNLSLNSNSGNNVISGDNPPTPTPTPTGTPEDSEPLPGCEATETTTSAESTDPVTQDQSNQDLSGSGGNNENLTVDASSENTQVGDQTVTNSETEDSDALIASNKNCAEIEAGSETSASTGGNSGSNNEGKVEMETGNATSSGTLVNEGNVNTTEISGSPGAENSQTGENSTNFSQSEETDTLIVENDNQISTENNLSVEAQSGENTLVDNEDGATLETGDLELFAYLLNILNMNISGRDFTHLIVNIFGNLTGDVDLDDIAAKLGMDDDYIKAVARNSQTGVDSFNSAEFDEEVNAEIENRNRAAVRNNVSVSGVTGENDASGNEDLVRLYTGRIKILAAILNFINANFSGTDWYFAMVNIFGNLHGDLFLPDPSEFLYAQGASAQNSQTGENSLNDADALLSTDISVTNQNQAQVTNNVSATADSGTNQAYANEDQTRMESGNTSVAAQILNWINYNFSGNNFVLLIVNVFGKWFGRVVAFPGKAPSIEAPENGMLMVTANEQTGAGSENYADSQSSLSLSVTNENQAQVENNINVEGVSGQNQTNQNEDGARVVTGWISLDINLFNIVNLNITGRNWMVLLVNVFGNFFGNLVFPQGRNLAQNQANVGSPPQEISPPETGGGGEDFAVAGEPQNTGSSNGNPNNNERGPGITQEKNQSNNLMADLGTGDEGEPPQIIAGGSYQATPQEILFAPPETFSPQALVMGLIQKLPQKLPKELPLAIYGIICLLTLGYLVRKRKIKNWEDNFSIPKINL